MRCRFCGKDISARDPMYGGDVCQKCCFERPGIESGAGLSPGPQRLGEILDALPPEFAAAMKAQDNPNRKGEST